MISAVANATTRASNYVSANTYNNLYPYMNNTMRTQLNPGVTPSQSGAQINTLVRTNTSNATTRNVVPRSATSTNNTASARSGVPTQMARAATNTNTNGTTTTRGVSARSATNIGNATARSASNAASASRRVVARVGTTSNTTTAPATTRSSRGDASTTTTITSTDTVRYTSTGEAVSSARCMADYINCMNGYCQREDTDYNRCYCSAKLAQIDAMYKSDIDNLIKQLIVAQGTNKWTDAEMDAYWQQMVVQYTGSNSWKNLDDALDIDWSSMASSVRGQQAFATGHSYCVQHLRNCAYMQTNLRDAYRSEIARDCAAYETTLQNMKTILESLIKAAK